MPYFFIGLIIGFFSGAFLTYCSLSNDIKGGIIRLGDDFYKTTKFNPKEQKE